MRTASERCLAGKQKGEEGHLCSLVKEHVVRTMLMCLVNGAHAFRSGDLVG